MPEYDMPIEEQIKVLVKEFRSMKESVDSRFDSIDRKIDKVQITLEDTREVLGKTRVLLEGTDATTKLGMEGLQGLRESMEERFASAAKANAEQIGLLKSVVVHIRTRVERVEPPKGRRRS